MEKSSNTKTYDLSDMELRLKTTEKSPNNENQSQLDNNELTQQDLIQYSMLVTATILVLIFVIYVYRSNKRKQTRIAVDKAITDNSQCVTKTLKTKSTMSTTTQQLCENTISDDKGKCDSTKRMLKMKNKNFTAMQMILAGANRKILIDLGYSDEELERVGYYRKVCLLSSSFEEGLCVCVLVVCGID